MTLVERLRANVLPEDGWLELMDEAADRIEALTAENAALKRDLANECERRDDIINCETHLRGEAEARVEVLEKALPPHFAAIGRPKRSLGRLWRWPLGPRF